MAPPPHPLPCICVSLKLPEGLLKALKAASSTGKKMVRTTSEPSGLYQDRHAEVTCAHERAMGTGMLLFFSRSRVRAPLAMVAAPSATATTASASCTLARMYSGPQHSSTKAAKPASSAPRVSVK
ncbi:MAG: hypothetical protein FRX49_08277 [Trebouxia sp. A1-2]|nr:MAG: hypothetical protein FRX49_08277 [Trebouxia sp. A1-2]